MEQAVSFCHVWPLAFLLVWTLDSGLHASGGSTLHHWDEPSALRTADPAVLTQALMPERLSLCPCPSVLCPLAPAVPSSSTHPVYPRHPRRGCPSQTSAGIGDNLPCHLDEGRGKGVAKGLVSLTSPRYASSHAGLVESMTMVFTERPSQHRSPPNHAPQHLC